MDVDEDRGGETSGDVRCTDDNIGCDSKSNHDPTASNVNTEMDLDLDSAQDENPLLLPPDQESPSHIFKSLNDHCLYEAFLRLHFLDLLNVSKVCIRFEAQATEAFASKYKKLRLNILECDRSTMEEILNNFGSLIQELRVNSNEIAADGDLFRAVIRNCSSGLKKLCLSSLNIQLDSPSVRSPFPKLEELEMIDCAGNLDLTHLIDECPNLKRIWMKRCDLQGANGMISRRFEKLEELTISNCNSDIETDALEHFIVSNPALTELTILLHTSRICTSHAIRLIGQNMLKLQKLAFFMPIDDLQHFHSDAVYIGRLQSLQHLALNFYGLPVAPIVNALATNNVPILKLVIFCGYITDNALQNISKLKQLTLLNIQYSVGLHEGHLMILARGLPGLQQMHLRYVMNQDGNDVPTIDGLMQMLHHAKKLSQLTLTMHDSTDYMINVDHYNIMLDTIRNRPGKIGLCINIKGKKSKLNVPEATLQANADVLSIKMNEK